LANWWWHGEGLLKTRFEQQSSCRWQGFNST